MENRYLIRGKSKKNEEYMYYCVDFQSGYPCWIGSDSGAKEMGGSGLIDVIKRIKEAYKKKSGAFYNPEVKTDSIEYVKIAYVEPRKFSEVTDEEIMWKQIEEKLTKEQIEFVKNKTKGTFNGN